MSSEALDQMYVEFIANYDQLMSATPEISSMFDNIATSADESSAIISDSFDMAGKAASSFAEMSQMAAENAASALGESMTPATEEVDSAFGDMAINITNNITEINTQITEMASNAETASSTMSESTSSAGGGFMDLFNKIGFGIMNMQNYANMAKNLAQGLLGPAISAETVTTALTTLDGSAQAAGQEMDKLNAFAAKTPFKTLDIDQAAEKLQGFGISANNVIPEITAIGDALGSVGKSSPAEMQSVVDIFGKINTEGKVTAMTMNELAVHGINGWKALADATGKTIPQVQDMVKKGLLPAKDAIADLTKGIEMNPLYQGGMAKAAGTFTGLLSTLQSNWDQVIAAFGTPIIKGLEGSLSNLGNILSSPAFQSFAGSIGSGIVSIFQEIGGAVGTVVGYLKNFDLSSITYAFQQLGSAVGTILSPFESLGNNKAASGFFTSLKNDLSQGIVSAIKDVSGFIEGLASALSGLSSNSGVTGFLSSLTSGFQQVSSIVGGTLSANFKTFSDIAQSLGKWWQTTMAPAIAAAMPGFESLGSTIATVVVPAFAKIWAVGQQVARELLPPLTQAFETIAPIVVKVGGFIAGTLGQAIQFLTPYIVQATQAIGDFAGQIIQKAIPIVQELWSFIQQGIAIILPIWNAVWPSMQQVLKGAWDIISGTVQVAWALVSGIIKIGMDALSGNWKGVWKDIQDTFNGVWNGMKTILSGVWNGIKGLISGGINAVIGIINDFINGLDKLNINIPGVGNVGIHIPDIPLVHFATGGYLPPGQVGVAGEEGQELIFGGTSGLSVMNHSQSMAAVAGGGAPEIHNHIYIDGRELSNQIMVQVLSQMRSSGHPVGMVM
jgi:tape measure domain-containing protein